MLKNLIPPRKRDWKEVGGGEEERKESEGPVNRLYRLIIMASFRIKESRCLGKKSNNRAKIQYALTVFHNMQLTNY